MRKSFTRFLRLLFVFCLVLGSFTIVNAQQNPAQETVKLYAGTSTACFNQSNVYSVLVSVKDFNKLSGFDLKLSYSAPNFTFAGYDVLSGWTGGGTLTVTSTTDGIVDLDWSGLETTIGMGAATPIDIIRLNFNLDNGTAPSGAQAFTWTQKTFTYNTSQAFTGATTDGGLTINQNYSDIVTEITHETCAGGQAQIKVTSPAGLYYSFNNGAFTSSNVFNPLPGNDVIIKVKSTNGSTDGCVSYAKTVNVPVTVNPVSFTVSSTSPACYGADASVFVTAAGGTATYTYYYNTSASLTGATTRNNFQFNVPTTSATTTYYIAVQDANGCANLGNASYWKTVTVQDTNPVVTVTSTVSQDVTCNGGANGAAAVSITPQAVYYVSIDGGVWTTTASDGTKAYSGLAAGTHTVTAKTVSDCTLSSTSFTITQPNALQITALTVSDTSCGGLQDGKIGVTIAGGSGTFTITVQEGSNATTHTGVSAFPDVFTNLKPTYYSLVATDANGCQVSYSNPNGSGNVIAVQKPTDIQFAVSKTDVLCYGATATATISSVTGGTGSFTYTVDTTTQTTTVFGGLTAGTHTATVANASGAGCPVSQVFTITGPAAALSASIAGTISPTCPDGTDGIITLNITGGSIPYKYQLNNSAWVDGLGTVTSIAVPVGTHTITVADKNSCTATTLVQSITQNTNSITVTSSHVILCSGLKDGTLTATVNTWAGNRSGQIFKYASNSDDVYTAAGQTLIPAGTQSATTFYAGTYYVGAIDAYGCTATPVKVVVVENGPVMFVGSIVTTAQSCYNSADGSIAITAQGGSSSGTTSPLQYAIVNDNVTSIPPTSWLNMPTYSSASKTYTANVQIGKGKYKVAVRDANCGQVVYPETVIVGGYDQILVDETKIEVGKPVCYGDPASINVTTVKGGNGSYKYTLYKSGVAVTGYVQQASGLFTGLTTGTYTVKVEDTTTCPSYTTASITISDTPKVTFAVAQQNISCNSANDGQITITAAGGTYSSAVTTAQYSYAVNNQNIWVPFVGTTKTYIATQPGTFTIWVKDVNGCTSTSTAVQILEPASISATVTVTKNEDCTSGGAVVVAATGGWANGTATSTFEYKLDANGSYTSSNSFTGLAAGTHSITVHSKLTAPVTGYVDNTDCVKVLTFTITKPNAITYNVSLSNVKCKDGNSGSFTVNVLGGGTASATDGYQVQLTGPGGYNSGYVWTGATNSKVFSNLVTGTYTVRIKDMAGCELSASTGNTVAPYSTVESWLLSQPSTALGVSAAKISDATCYANADGVFTITANGGSAPYKFFTDKSSLETGHILLPSEIADNSWINVASGSTYTKTDASRATWIVWTQDANGCVVGGETLNGVPVNAWRVKIDSPSPITFAVGNVTSPTCNGSTNGSIQVLNIAGGTASYSVTVTGVSKAGVPVSATKTLNATSITVPGLPASNGYYTISVADVKGCTATYTVTRTVNEPEPLTVSLVKSEGSFTCPGSIEGWIDATATGGTAGYKYRLYKDNVLYVTTWQTTSTFLVQVGHTYKVEVIDNNGAGTCTATAEAVIDEPKPVVASIKETTCYMDPLTTPAADFKASVIVKATGTPGRTFSVRYRLNTGTYTTTWTAMDANNELAINGLLFSNVNAGQNFYYFQIKDDKGCITELTDLSFVPTQHPLQVTASVADLNASVVITGGISPYSYKVGTATVTLATNGDTFQVVNLPAGQNTITVYDAHGCSYPVVANVAPLAVTADPASGNAMKNSFDVKLTFNRDVTGVASATTAVGGTVSSVTGSGKVYTVTIVGADLTTVTLTVGNTVKDAAGSTLSPSASFTYNVGDNTAPKLVDKTPNNVTLPDNHPVFVMTFDENVVVGTGNLKVYKKAGDVLTLTVPVTGATVSGKTATLTYVYDSTKGGLDQNTDYYVVLDAGAFKDAAGNPSALTSNTEWTFKTGPFTGTDPEVNALVFKVYPNPFVDQVFVDNASELTKVVVSNIAGQVVKEVVYPERTIQLDELRSGVYFISLYIDNKVVYTAKLLKR